MLYPDVRINIFYHDLKIDINYAKWGMMHVYIIIIIRPGISVAQVVSRDGHHSGVRTIQSSILKNIYYFNYINFITLFYIPVIILNITVFTYFMIYNHICISE